jgi:hypothetical protein
VLLVTDFICTTIKRAMRIAQSATLKINSSSEESMSCALVEMQMAEHEPGH